MSIRPLGVSMIPSQPPKSGHHPSNGPSHRTPNTPTTNAPQKPNTDSPKSRRPRKLSADVFPVTLLEARRARGQFFCFQDKGTRLRNRDQLFRHVVGKVYLFRVAGEVFQGKHSQRLDRCGVGPAHWSFLSP